MLTTVIARVSAVPLLPSRISLRMKSVSDGNGPAVSVGVTAHAAFVFPVVVPPVVVVGLAGVSPHPTIKCRSGGSQHRNGFSPANLIAFHVSSELSSKHQTLHRE